MQLVGQSFSIGPLIDIALFLSIVAALAGAIGPLAVALAAAGMMAFSLVVAFYASETGGAGAMGDYMARAWGPTAGTGALGIYVLSLLFSGAAGFGIVVGELISRFAVLYFGIGFPWWAGALLVCGAAWWLNVRGASLATKVQLVIVAVSVIPFLLTAAAAVIHAGSANTWAVFSWSNPHRGDLFAREEVAPVGIAPRENRPGIGRSRVNHRRRGGEQERNYRNRHDHQLHLRC